MSKKKMLAIKPRSVHVKSHSWTGKPCHITRSSGKVQRGMVEDIIVETSGNIVVNVKFRTGKTTLRSKKVSPLFLIALDVLWHHHEIVTDDDPDTDDELGNMIGMQPLGQLTFPPESLQFLTISQRERLDKIGVEIDVLNRV